MPAVPDAHLGQSLYEDPAQIGCIVRDAGAYGRLSQGFAGPCKQACSIMDTAVSTPLADVQQCLQVYDTQSRSDTLRDLLKARKMGRSGLRALQIDSGCSLLGLRVLSRSFQRGTMGLTHVRLPPSPTHTLEQHVDLTAAVGRQLAEQVVGDALGLLGALPQHVLQEEQVILADQGAPIGVRGHLCTGRKPRHLIANPALKWPCHRADRQQVCICFWGAKPAGRRCPAGTYSNIVLNMTGQPHRYP